jgi:glycosyltransferase involved in cell wall biosynthesis
MVKTNPITVKVLFFIDSMIAGGKERRLTELMKSFKTKPGVEFELVVMNKDIHYKEVFDLGIKIHYLIRKTKKDLSVFKQFYTICKQSKPDLVHCWDSMTAVYSIPACKLLGIKFVNGMIVDAPQKQNVFNKYWLRAKMTFLFSNIIIGNSKAGLEAYSVPKRKSFFIYNGFNFNRTNNIISAETIRAELAIKTQYVVGMVATFSEYKDYKTYFNAAQQILAKRNDVSFLAIGADTDSASAKAFIDDKYADNFRLLGKRTGVESLINAIDVCVLSTFTEGISNSILEYMAMGKPVVASEGGGTNEIVEDNSTGFLVKQSDPGELVTKIDILLNNAALRKKMGTEGQQRIRTVFSIDHMCNEYIELYEMVIKNKLITN